MEQSKDENQPINPSELDVEVKEGMQQEDAAEQTSEEQPLEKKGEEDLAAQVKELQDKVASLEDTKLRLMAEFENFRRRTNKEKLDLIESAGERIFTDMLPLMDDFERALQSIDKTDDAACSALKEGVSLIYQKFVQFLANNQVVPIETDGKDFSTDEHEAITTLAMGDDKKGKIIDCTQKGYKLGDKVIRYAKVVVGE